MNARVLVALLLGALLTGSCGSGASSPASPTAAPTVPAFAPGNYTLQLSTPGTPPPAQAGYPVLMAVMCIGVGDMGFGASASIDVTVEVQGTQLIGRSTSGSLLLDVTTFGTAIGGGLSGAAANPAAGVSVLVQPLLGDKAIGLSGTVTSSRTMSGYADGSVQISTSSGSAGCNSANWSLSPR